MKKIIPWLIGIALLLIIGGVIGKKKGWFGAKEEGIKVAVEPATVKEIIGTVSATGKIYPENEVKISPDVSGEIVELLVEEGDSVVKGQILVKIFAEEYQTIIDRSISVLNNSKAGVAQAEAGVAQAEAGVLQAQASVGQAKASVEQAKGQLLQSKARTQQALNTLNNTKIEHERNQRLFKEELISQKELAASELQVQAAETEYATSQQAVNVAEQQVQAAKENLKSAEEQVNSQLQTVKSAKASKKASEYNVQSVKSDVIRARTDLQRTIIRAPRSGIISKMSVEKGERVVGTSQMAGTEIMTISNLDNMECRVEVSEIDIARVNYGDDCEIEVDSYPGKKFTGKVTKISNTTNGAQQVSNDQVTNYLVTVNIDTDSYQDLKDKKFPFRPGMSASVDIITEREDSKIAVPIQAVVALTEKQYKKIRKDSTSNNADDKELLEYVYVVRNNEADIIPVKSGFQDSDNIIIETGLTIKDSVIVAPYNEINKGIKKGETVVITDKDKLYDTKKKSNK